jgi:surface polysaccharide O-acyltransferase-like enzyme
MNPREDSIEVGGVSATHERRRDLDLMRMFVVVGLVFFHSARIFDTGGFYVKNDPTSDLVTVVIYFASLWGMPLLYVIAGMGIWYSLRSRRTTAFAWERVRRLLVPLVFGVLVIVPPQVWTRLRGDPTYDESYWQFLSRFFDVELNLAEFPFVIGDDPARGLFEVGHLWFVVLLFAFSFLLLPVIWYLRRPAGLRIIDRLAGEIDHLWVIAAAGLPFAALDAALGSEEGLAGWNRYSYAVFILYGYLLATDRRFGRVMRRHRKGALILGIVTFIAVGALFELGSENEGVDILLDHDAASMAMRTLKGVSGWLWVVAIMGFAAGSGEQGRATQGSKRGSAVLNRVGAYTSEAVLPIYVLHQTVIVLLGFYVVEWSISATVKYLTISLISLAIILGIYDLAVRRTRPTRFLFGMKRPVRESPGSVPVARRQPPISNR